MLEILYTFADKECDDVRKKVVAISRAERFSPHSIEKDRAILQEVTARLCAAECDVETIREDELAHDSKSALQRLNGAVTCLSMCRSGEALSILNEVETRGVPVINSTESVRTCISRRAINDVMAHCGVPLPPSEGPAGYWLKRADGTAESASDVRFAADAAERDRAYEEMMQAGMDDVIVQAHVEGDLVKFYGVSGTDFFHICYPGDDGQTKFGDERRNGKPRHYPLDVDRLRAFADVTARASGTDVYGGDCIVDDAGGMVIIDFNDWPSFSRCRDAAAEAIKEIILKRIEGSCEPSAEPRLLGLCRGAAETRQSQSK